MMSRPRPGLTREMATDCQPPSCLTHPNDQLPRFSSGTVKVTYNPNHFSPEQVQAIRNGYMAWNGPGAVNFVLAGSATQRRRPPVSRPVRLLPPDANADAHPDPDASRLRHHAVRHVAHRLPA